VKRRRRDFACFDGWVLVLPPSLLDRRYETCMPTYDLPVSPSSSSKPALRWIFLCF
jgi:hypothetical protein